MQKTNLGGAVDGSRIALWGVSYSVGHVFGDRSQVCTGHQGRRCQRELLQSAAASPCRCLLLMWWLSKLYQHA